MTPSQMAKSLGCSVGTAYNYIRRFGMSKNPSQSAELNGERHLPREWLIEEIERYRKLNKEIGG